jgi:hypothetical protein
MQLVQSHTKFPSTIQLGKDMGSNGNSKENQLHLQSELKQNILETPNGSIAERHRIRT